MHFPIFCNSVVAENRARGERGGWLCVWGSLDFTGGGDVIAREGRGGGKRGGGGGKKVSNIKM